MKNSAPHTIRISMVWPKSGSITSSDTSDIRSTSAIEVAGISGRFVDSANSQAAITTKAGFADSEAWMLTPSSVIQRREPFTSGPNSSVATISAIADREHEQRGTADLARRQERDADHHHERRQQEHHVAVEEVERIEPDPGRHRRARRQRQDDAAQDQRDDRGQQRACPRSTTSRKTACVGRGRSWTSPMAEVTPIGGAGWFPEG